MSDQQPTSIEVIKQQVSALADPAATFQQIEHGLGDIWTAAEARGDQQTIDYLQLVWNNTQALAANNTAANNVAAAALQTAVEMAEAAAQATQQYGQLVSDMSGYYNTRNPLVNQLLEQHESDLIEMIYAGNDYGAIHDDSPGETAYEREHFGDMPSEDIEDFLHIVYGDSDELPAEMYAEIADFINTMLPAARQYWYEQRPFAKNGKYPVQRYNSAMTSTHAAYAATFGAAEEAETDDGEEIGRAARTS